jgi:hypothetical protein
MWAQILYGSSIMSFEGSLSCTNTNGTSVPSPIGVVQQAGMAWSDAVGKGGLGVHLANVAVLLDFWSGFTPPRHLYSDAAYRVWGGLPYESSDFFTHGMLDLLYPGYEKSSYFHNESGFVTGTPHTDGCDVLLTDAPEFVLEQYPVMVLGTPLRALRAEVVDKLSDYVHGGGTLVVTAAAAASIPILGVSVDLANATGGCTTVPAGATVRMTLEGGNPMVITEAVDVGVCRIFAPSDAEVVVATTDAVPLLLRLDRGNGTVFVLASTGVAATARVPLPIAQVEGLIDRPLPNPYPLATHVRLLLDDVLSHQTPFTAGAADGLAVVATRVAHGRYWVGVSNTELQEHPLALASRLGTVESVTEARLADAYLGPAGTPGYTATHTPPGTDLGRSTNTTIAGLDFRLFAVVVDEANTTLISRGLPPPSEANGGPRGPRGVALPLHGGRTLHEQLLLRPTFVQHFDTVVLDWRQIEQATAATLAMQGRWAFRQNVSIMVDLTSGLNLYPDLRLCNNSASEYGSSVHRIEAILGKMATKVNASTPSAATAQFSRNLVLSLHRAPENDYIWSKCLVDFAATIARLSVSAAQLGVTLHLRVGTDNKEPSTLAAADAFLLAAGSPPNLKLAVSTAMLVLQGTIPTAKQMAQIGLWMASASVQDPLSTPSATPAVLTGHGSLTLLDAQDQTATAALFRLGGGSVPVVLDAALLQHDGTSIDGLDQEYAEVKAVDGLVALS